MIRGIRDITERKQAEEESREPEEKYRSLLEPTSDLIQNVNSDGSFLYVNKNWLEVMGYTTDEVKKMKFADILRKDGVLHCMESFRKICSGEHMNKLETVFITKNRKEIYVEGDIEVLLKDGKIFTTQGIFRAITGRRQTEKELKQSQAIPETANRARREFPAGMSHEISTPIYAIIGMTNLLLDTVLTREQTGYIHTVRKSAASLFNLLSTILDLSKTDAGRMDMHASPSYFTAGSVIVPVPAKQDIYQTGINFNGGNSWESPDTSDTVLPECGAHEVTRSAANTGAYSVNAGTIKMEVAVKAGDVHPRSEGMRTQPEHDMEKAMQEMTYMPGAHNEINR